MTGRAPKGARKLAIDTLTIVEMEIHFLRQSWIWYLLGSFVFPMAIFFWSRALAPDDAEAVRWLITGTIVFGVSIMTANSLADQIVQDRFQGRLKLIITMPMSKISYAFGILTFAEMQSFAIVGFLLVLDWLAGAEFTLTPFFVIVIAPLVLTMAGLVLFLASLAPNAEVGGIINEMVGILPVMLSPVFFTMDQAPLLLRFLG